MNKYIHSILVCSCLFFYSCQKQEQEYAAIQRLQKIITNGVDSLGNFSTAALFFQFFTYDVNGNLVSIRDSSDLWRGWYTGPQPWGLNRKESTIDYSFGNLLKIKSSRDSFVYNNRNQVIAKLRRIYSDTSRYFTVNRFAYDIKGNLVADSGYVTQSYSKPDGVLYGYDQYTYDDRGNVTRNDRVDLWPAGTVKHTTYTAIYDTQKNPYKRFGLLPYCLFYNNGFFLSTNNKIEPGYTYEYKANGLLKKISYQGFVQEYFYE
jgi:hypothetical protein